MTLSVHEQLHAARVEAGLTQTQLADRLKCSQPQISRLESGDVRALSLAKVRTAAAILGVELVPGALDEFVGRRRRRSAHGVCTNPRCLGNVPVPAAAGWALRPTLYVRQHDDSTRCVECGDTLEFGCPHCHAELMEGSFCATCGNPYVFVPEAYRDEIASPGRLALLREIREWTASRPSPHSSKRVRAAKQKRSRTSRSS